MLKLNEFDFYYGAVLSALLREKINPVLIESDENRGIYDFTTNNQDFRLIVKHRSVETPTKNEDYSSWQFSIKEIITDLEMGIKNDKKLLLGLICGKPKLYESEYAVLNKDQIKKLLDADKELFTVSRKKAEKAFRISMGGSRKEDSMKVKTSQLY